MNETNSALDALLSQVDAAALMDSVREITRQVRLSGTPEEAEIFRLLKRKLTALGLDVALTYHKAYVSLPREAALTVDGKAVRCTTHSMLPSVSALTGALVYCPAEKIAEEYKEDIRGKIIVTEGLALADVMRAAERRGAAGVIFITGRHIHEMIVSDLWGSPTPGAADDAIKIPAVSISQGDGETLKQKIQRGTCGAVMTAVVENRWTDLPLLTADLSCDASEQYLLLSAHVDSWHRGAMDNASGNAAALEIARLLTAVQADLRRGVKFVFWSGHSHGRYAGSAAYCDANFHDLYARCFLHVNADCLGGRGAAVLTQAACMAETKRLGATAILKVTGEILEGVRFGRSSDQSFWGTGTPSLFSGVSEQPPTAESDASSAAFALLFGGGKSGGFGWWWHTTEDTVDKIAPENLKRDCQIYLAAVYTACTALRIPFQLSAGTAELRETLRRYAALAGEALDFTAARQAAESLHDAIVRVEQRESRSIDPDDANAYNRFAVKLEQILIPLGYVKGSRYAHDPATRQPHIPKLEEVADLAAARAPNERHALQTLLRRRLNDVHCSLCQAHSLVSDFLAERGKAEGK